MTDETLEKPSLPGARLREQRERKGLTVAQAASELHVDRRLLEALEDDRFDDIGAPIFVKGHLRNYARLLGLDPAELVAEYEAARAPAEPALVAHRPDGPRMEPGGSQAWVGWLMWLFVIVLAVLLGGWWYYEQEGGGELVISPAREPVSIAERPQSVIPGEQAASEPAVEEPAVADEATPAENEPTPAITGQAEAVTPDEQQAESAQAVTPSVQRPAQRQAPAASGRGLVLEFSEESWVEIYDAEGRPILYDLMTPGTRREINASGELRVFLGNAEGVEVMVAGEAFDVGRYTRRDSTARFTVNVPSAE